MKKLKEESLKLKPGATEGDVWVALIMAEKVIIVLWNNLLSDGWLLLKMCNVFQP